MNIATAKGLRRELRNRGTSAEAVLWSLLKNKQLDGLKFRRQQSVGPYVVDFYCPTLQLAVELDGAVHDNPQSEEYDEARTKYLMQNGDITVLRFENKEVFCNQELIVAEIREFAVARRRRLYKNSD